MFQKKNKDRSKKKTTIYLPKNFFEKVCDLELELSKDFNIITLQELTKLFKIAIEYYESIGDPRYIDYTNRLNILLTRNDLLKFINRDRNKRAGSFSIKDRNKHRVNYLLNFNLSENNNRVKECISQSDSLNRSKELIIVDISKQENNFKQRLDDRRKSKSPSLFIPAINRKIQLNNSENLVIVDSDLSQNIDLEDNTIVTQILGSPKGFTTVFEEDLDLIKKKIEKRKNEIKNNKFLIKIDDQIDDFLIKFNDYFNNNIFTYYTTTIKNLMEEKYQKYLEICNYYDNQIKEMEILQKGVIFIIIESKEEHKSSIIEIIDHLKIEMDKSLKKNEETGQILIKDAYEEFQNIGFSKNDGVKSIEMTFEADIYNKVRNILSSN